MHLESYSLVAKGEGVEAQNGRLLYANNVFKADVGPLNTM